MAKKLTHQEFLNNVYKKNNHYKNGEFTIKGQYINSRTNIECECPTHGSWFTKPDNLSNGCGCPKCGVAMNSLKQRSTHDAFLQKLYDTNEHYRNGEFKVTGEYINSTTPIECECHIHGKWNTSIPRTLLNKNVSCPKCGGTIKKSHSEFLQDLYEKNEHYRNGEFDIKGKYINNRTKIECSCPIHGVWNMATPDSLLQGAGCPKCKGLYRTTSDFLRDLYERNEHYRNGEFKVVGEYINAITTIKCECLIHGEWNTSTASSLLASNVGCPICAGKITYTTERFLEKLYEKNEHYRNGEFKVIGKYIDSYSHIECECPIHGKWNTSAAGNLLRQNSGCPQCIAKSTSFPENYLRCALQAALPDAEIPDKGDKDLLKGYEIDIPVYKYGFALEYGAWYWHKKRWERDVKKINKLEEQGIILYTIYDSFDNSVDFSKYKNIYTYTIDLSAKKNLLILQNFVDNLLKDIDHNDIDWDFVKSKATLLSKALDTDRFIEKLYEKNEHYRNGEFDVIGSYVNSSMPIEIHCNICGLTSFPRPGNLISGHGGCKKCANKKGTEKRKKSNEDFIKELYDKNEHYRKGKFVLLGEYDSYKVPIKCECIIHGEWDAKVDSLLKGCGCPRCGKQYRKVRV